MKKTTTRFALIETAGLVLLILLKTLGGTKYFEESLYLKIFHVYTFFYVFQENPQASI